MSKSYLRYSYLILLPLAAIISACSNLNITPPKPEERPISVITGKPQGTPIEELLEERNNHLVCPSMRCYGGQRLILPHSYRLKILIHLVVVSLTEWYIPEDQPNRRLKLAVFVVGLELRSDAIQVRAYVQTRDGNDWANAGRDAELGRKLEDLILTRARELRAAAISETSN